METESLSLRIARLIRAVREGGGVVRTTTLAKAGHSTYVIARAVDGGELMRVRKGWVAVPHADSSLITAAKSGVIMTCISQARALGLWVLADEVLHVGAPVHSGSVNAPRARIHWAKPLVPRHPDALVDPLANVLTLVADCQPHERALAIWESALNKQLITLDELRRLPLSPAARALCDAATPWSDSGLESFVVPRLRWMHLPITPQVWIAGHRVDILIGDRLVLQIDGGTHVGAQRTDDIAHDAALMLLGYHVIRVGYQQIVHGWAIVQDLIMRAVAQGLHLAA